MYITIENEVVNKDYFKKASRIIFASCHYIECLVQWVMKIIEIDMLVCFMVLSLPVVEMTSVMNVS